MINYKSKYIFLKIIRLFLFPIIYLVNFILEKFNFFILFSRGKGLGDGVAVTGLISQLKKKTKSNIILFTEISEIYENNPNVVQVFKLSKKIYLFYLLILFNGKKIIELNTKTHPYKDIFELQKANSNKNFKKKLVEIIGGNIENYIDFKNLKNEIFFSESEIIKFNRKFENIIKKKFALIAPTCKNDYIPVRNWGFEKFQRLVNQIDFNWYQADGEHEKKLDNVKQLSNTSKRELFFLIQKSNFVLANDTSLNHIANCFNIKSFVIMSGFIHKDWVKYKNTIVVTREPQIECSPCYLKEPCFRDIKYCTEDIKVEKVKEIITKNID
jgi:ADP-heptose:LPS heptosyltransferase